MHFLNALNRQDQVHLYEILCVILHEKDDAFTELNLQYLFKRFCNTRMVDESIDTAIELLRVQSVKNGIDNKRQIILDHWSGTFDDMNKSKTQILRILDKYIGQNITILILGG